MDHMCCRVDNHIILMGCARRLGSHGVVVVFTRLDVEIVACTTCAEAGLVCLRDRIGWCDEISVGINHIIIPGCIWDWITKRLLQDDHLLDRGGTYAPRAYACMHTHTHMYTRTCTRAHVHAPAYAYDTVRCGRYAAIVISVGTRAPHVRDTLLT
jgi:ABC-type nickel/cobalt efflux system permease component RcnA